ncbi:MAG TPA: zinc-binding dehydrogenase [SAR86 cluster bacterium]|nr:zinc-binding dehydrogenase [SAR86 cluster bacterium]
MMYSAVIRDYGDESSFEIDETSPLPELRSNQVLVKISASSVNPIDLMKRQGYGRSIFEKQRRTNFPWILGSDFSGHVVNVGQKVTRFKEGDEVWGCTSKANSGTYAEYAAIDQEEVNIKPKNLSFEEAASLPYVFLTTWSAIVRWAGLRPQDLDGKKVFIQGGAGGVGTIAIQLFKYWGCEVSSTCSAKNVNLLQSLGATKVINYQKEIFQDIIDDQDLVYDLLGDSVLEDSIGTCCKVLKKNSSSQYITLTHPLINTLDDKGLLLGAPHAFFLRQKIKSTHRPINVHWSIYRPSLSGLQELTYLSEEEIIKPIIDSIYPLSDISKAHKKVATGHGSGKVVINNIL